LPDAVIVAAARTPVGRAPRGALHTVRPDELAATAIAGALRRAPGVPADAVEDVLLGCAMPEAEQGLNVARIAALRAGLPVSTAAATVNRFCASGLQALAWACGAVAAGGADAVVAGGTESMSLVPMGGHKVSPNPTLVDQYPDVYLTTGLAAEGHVADHGISREAQDAFALESHRRAVAARAAGRFVDEIEPVAVRTLTHDADGVPHEATVHVRADEGPRDDTSLQALAGLRPAFREGGSVTAGNSSQTSDGAAALLVTSSTLAARHGLEPLGRLVGYATAGVAPERFGIGPVPAVRRVLERTGLTLDDMDLVELNEAFAAQVLACLRELPIDPARLNVNGGAIALGHPLGCTGARLSVSLLHEMRRRGARYGLVTMCVGGGMGAAAILERL
jgi:acetyl-CoA acyltransferase